ncbi:MAG: efflux RND transporter permease subunit [Candidatus Symbiobacter sp.]|nr:efflux RND transporter permease subunit [Candidatus Symbiobacter sp.]
MSSSFTDIFIKRPVLAIVVSLLILVVGVRALMTLPIRQYPKLSEATITVTTAYPGASADVMQGFITSPLEQALGAVEGLEYMTSTSAQNISSITLRLNYTVNPDIAITDVMTKVNQVAYLLPKQASTPVVSKSSGRSTSLMYIAFSSKSLNAAVINDNLERIVSPILSTIPGIGSINILGGPALSMRVWLDPKRMAARGISALDVYGAIASNNFQSAPGQAKSIFTITNITAETGATSVESFRQLVIKSVKGKIIRLGEIADVAVDAATNDATVRINGDTAVFIGVDSSIEGNPLTVAESVRRILPVIQKSLPPDLEAKIGFDGSVFIQSSIEEVEKTLIEAVVVVIVIIFAFLGSLRTVIIPVVTIPLSLVGACLLMTFMGFSLNLITLLAFVLAIGLVVDDAIVVVENVYRHIEEGETPLNASLKGAREIVGPIVAMTITLAAVYAPIGLLGGVTGALFTEFAFTLAGAVLVSGVIALTLSPMMCSVLLTRASMEAPLVKRIEHILNRLALAYRRRLARLMEYRTAILIFAAGILALVPFFYINSPKELAPQEDQGSMFMFLKGPQYANLDYMSRYLTQLDEIVATTPEIVARFGIAGFPALNQGFGGAILKPWDERSRSTMTVAPELSAKLSSLDGIAAFVFQPPSLPGNSGGPPAQMVIRGPGTYKEIFNIMNQIKDITRASGKFIFVDSDLTFENPTIHIKIDNFKANQLGITMAAIGQTLTIMVGGNYVNYFNLEGRAYRVIPQVARVDRLKPEDLANYYVPTITGGAVPLSTVVTFVKTIEPGSLTRFNQLNSATFNAVPRPFVTMADAVAAMSDAATKALPPGYSYEFLSEARQYVQEGNRLLATFVFALVIIFLVLAAQFDSLRDPLVILVSVPMSVAGALLPLFFGLSTINIYSQIGLVTLIGLIAKHGILMVSFARNLQVEHGWNRHQAIIEAAQIRLRPILMTTGAMVVGLFPLLVASGAGAASRFSIGLVIVAGMSIGTLFTLFVLPAVYTVLGSERNAQKHHGRD